MKYKHIIFDFDGVLVESNEIRFEGFKSLFINYPGHQVEKLIQFVRLNAGISRYEKINYFFKKIRGEPINEHKFKSLAKRYSDLVRQKVIDAPAVKGSLEFLSEYYNRYDFAVVSGSDQEELRDVCFGRKIDHYFVEILGSPTKKEDNISNLISKMKWAQKTCLFVGDSINDLHAAQANGIDFIARDSGTTNWSSDNNIRVIKDISGLELILN